MQTKWKVAIVATIVATIAALAFIIKYQHDMLQRQYAIEKSVVEMKLLQDGIVRSESKYATKDDIERFAKDRGLELKPIKDDLKKLDAELKGVNSLLARTPGRVVVGVPSTSTTPRPDAPEPPKAKCPDGSSVECPNQDEFGYLSSKQNLKLTEPFADATEVPFGDVSFSAWKKKPWDVRVLPRDYRVMTTLSTDEDGRHYVHNKFTITTGGKDYTIPITKSEFVEKYPIAEFRFSPRLYLGVDGGVYFDGGAALVPNAQVALFSHGKTKLNPDWTFLGLGFGYATQEEIVTGVISPVNYNIGRHLPLMENLFIGPTFGITVNGNLSVMGGIRAGL